MPQPPELSLPGEVFAAARITDVTALRDGADRTAERTITARLASYGSVNHPRSAWDMPIRLLDGALQTPETLSDVKLMRDHNPERVIGVMTDAEEKDGALYGTFRLGSTVDAEEALSLVRDGILDAVSVGYRLVDAAYATIDGEDVLDVQAATLFETSIVGHPADASARISAVTAQKGNVMPDIQTPPPAPEAPAIDMDALAKKVAAQMAPAAAAPVAAPSLVQAAESRIVDQDGNAIALRGGRTRYPAARGRNGALITAGEFFSSFHAGVKEGKWERHNEIRQALADELSSDVPGLLPQQIVGELLGRASGRRPLWDSLTQRDMPMTGEKFSRPRITQHVQVAPQTAQKTEIASRKYTVGLDDVAKVTLAGGLDVSQQALDWTSPSLLNELILDFTRIYIARTDAKAATDLVAATTAGAQTVAWDGTAATIGKALADAAALVYDNAPEEADAFPNTLWMSADVWALIAGLTDTTGRPLFPALGAMNAYGTNQLSNPETGLQMAGFRVVVDKNLPAGTLIMGDREYTEAYENGRRFLQAVNVPLLGLDIAYMGYVATFFPYPTTLVKITVPPAGGGALAADTKTATK